MPPIKRNPKACENCRSRRIKCNGRLPCEACQSAGIADRCQVRQKARPMRLPRVAVADSSSLFSTSWRASHFVLSVEKDIEKWAEDHGEILTAAVSDVFYVRTASSSGAHLVPLPPRTAEQAVLEMSYLQRCLPSLPYFGFIDYVTLLDILSRYHADPAGLDPTERVLLFAAFCVGCQKQAAAGVGVGMGMGMGVGSGSREHSAAVWFRRCLAEMDTLVQPSTKALIALHMLHMYSVEMAGILETRDILKRMATHVAALRDHQGSQEDQDQAAKLYFATIYKDTWHATLCDSPPFLNLADSVSEDIKSAAESSLDSGPVSVPVLLRLTEFENELLMKLHHSIPLSQEYIAQVSKKWARWTADLRDEQERGTRSILYIYANIRFHWLRLLLHYPLRDLPLHAAASSALLARSVSHIIRSYSQAGTYENYTSTWTDLRRVASCTQLVIVLHDNGELLKEEAEDLLTIGRRVLRRLATTSPMALDVEKTLEALARLAGLSLPPDVPVVAMAAPPPQDDFQLTIDNTIFDASLAPFPDDNWIFGLDLDLFPDFNLNAPV